MIDPAAHARIDRWKQSLLDPSNRLLDLGDHGVPIGSVDLVRLAFSLAAGGGFVLPPEHDRELVALRRAASDARADGEHVLWLALGLLTWCDGNGQAHVAPLVLWPVALDGTRLVAAASRRPRLNDLLALRLREDHALTLGDHDLDLAVLLEAAADIAASRAEWRLDRIARLGAFSFAGIDQWRDLDARGVALAESPPVAWLAGMASTARLIAATGDVLAPLDADASQLAAVAAAGAGSSFVLHGPPGTGKSQTIANLIVHCVSHGKTVLVVSDRASALDVVRERLAAIGLGEFCVPLHDTGADVVASLGRALDRSFRPGATTGSDAKLAELRATLDGYVGALHETGALGMSMHEVLGRLVELRTTPRAALAEPDASSLDRATFARRYRAVSALAQAAVRVEPIATHPWRTSALDALDGEVTQRAARALADAADAAAALAAAVADVGVLVPALIARTSEQLRALGALAELAAASPRPGTELLTGIRGGRTEDVGERVALIRARGGGAIDVPRDPTAFLVLAARHRALLAEVDDNFTDKLAALDASELWTQLKRWTGSMAPVRYVALRAARAEVRDAAQAGRLETDEAMLAALEAAIAERACRKALCAAAEPARRWFGDLAAKVERGGLCPTLGEDDPVTLALDQIEAAVAWSGELRRAFDQVSVVGGEPGRQAAWRALVAQVAATPGGEPGELGAFAQLSAAAKRWDPAIRELATATGIAHATIGAGADHLTALRDQLAALRDVVDSLGDWARFHLARRAAVDAGLGPAITAIERGDLAAADLAAAWQRATLLAWADAELRATPELAGFNGVTHHAHAAAFADLDRSALALARARALARLAERMPRGRGKDVDPEILALRHELAQPQQRPLRAVLAELPTLLPRLAPCLLATPHAIAEHLDAALPAFDLVVFDEASRLPIAHALGALVRASSAVIVGDTRQPGPAGGADGLLDGALAAGMPTLSLAAHYRSRHEDLFAFANRRYYGDRLEVLPVARGSAELGISWRHVDGTADAAGANRIEADAIVAELVARLREPVKRSLAVVTMSRAQQQLIEDALAATGEAGDVLIGTPDRLQGEERDVVLVSIGHGADALGALAHPGGERWLDVAITRAREQLIVVSSFAPEAVTSDAPAARDLVELLAFARAGGGAARSVEDVAASPITAAIARALTDRGWIVRHQVGCGPYKIDLAVVDPNDPERYVLAIEHDGRAYASAAAARNRDRMRAQVLARLGWRMHRVWALDWWTDAAREVQRAHGAIVAAIAGGRQRRAAVTPRRVLAHGSAPHVPVAAAAALAAGSGPTLPIADGATTPMRLPRGAIAIGPYTAAAVPAGRRAPDDMFAPRYVGELGKLVEQVLAAEAPMHVDLLTRRVGAYFGIGRVTPRVTEQVLTALVGRGRLGDEEGVVWRIDQDPTAVPAVRVAGSSAAARRDIGEVPLSELASAARIVVERAHGLSASDLVRDCARLLGFARLTERVTERVALGVRLAAARELIAIDDDKAQLPS